MNMPTINTFINYIDSKIETYSEFKDASGISDIMEVLDDNLSIFKGISSVTKYISKKRFAYFLKGLDNNNIELESSLSKLYSYIDDESKAEFITKTIDRVLRSNSKKSAFLLGVLASELISNKKDPDFKELICVTSLGKLHDYDLENLISIWKYLDDDKVRHGRNDWFSISNLLKKWAKENNINIDDSIELTIEKCVSLQLIIKDFHSDINIDSHSPEDATVDTNKSYKFTIVGNQLKHYCSYLEKLNI